VGVRFVVVTGHERYKVAAMHGAEIGLVVGAAVAFVATWLLGGAWVAAAIEIVLVRDARQAMVDEGLPVRPAAGSGSWLSIRVVAGRMLAHVPTVLAVGIGSVSIANVAYVELTDPFEVATPLVVRVIA